MTGGGPAAGGAPGDAGAGVEVERLGVRRRRRWVLRGLDWAHGVGEIAWLVGENGAGKSSLLRVLAGRDRPSEGRATLRPGSDPAPRTAWFHPGMRLPPEVRGADWDRLVDALTPGWPRLEALRPARADARTRVGRLSTGEAKRLQLEAVLRRPATFAFLDEPYSNLSAAGRAALTDVLVARARGAIVVVATNQAIPAGAGGVVVEIGRP